MARSTVNLSLLSRGIGEVTKNGQEKVQIKLEPEDYLNLQSDSFFLPPLSSSRSLTVKRASIADLTPRSGRHQSVRTKSASSTLTDQQEVLLPKTFTTRRGALLLFSEDYAAKSSRDEDNTRGLIHQNLSKSAEDLSLRTLNDLGRAVLTYGASGDDSRQSTTCVSQLPYKGSDSSSVGQVVIHHCW